jgi:hypothetical protein
LNGYLVTNKNFFTHKTQSMKNFGAIILFILFGALTLVSCKKDYTCKCTITVTGFLDTTYVTMGTINDKKSNAQDQCEANDGTITDGFGDTIVTNCQIE